MAQSYRDTYKICCFLQPEISTSTTMASLYTIVIKLGEYAGRRQEGWNAGVQKKAQPEESKNRSVRLNHTTVID